MNDIVNKNDDISHQSLSNIATTVPGATAIFRKYKLDFCCGGSISLANATKQKNLDLDSITGELVSAKESAAPGFRNAPQDHHELIDYIVERYHNVHRSELPELISLSRRVEKVHANKPEVPAGLTALLEDMEDALEGHMQKEEHILFPLMHSGGSPMIGHPIAMMRHEHLEHRENLNKLASTTNDFEPPECACPTWRALYVGLRKLSDDIMDHINLENNILFPHFGA